MQPELQSPPFQVRIQNSMHPMFQVLDTPGHSVSRRRTQKSPRETLIRLFGIHHNMWLDAKSQRHKVIDAAIEVAAYLYKNDNLWIDQRLKVISMCLPSLFSFSAPLIDWPESDLKLLTTVWVRAYKNAWNLGKAQQPVSLPFLGKRADFGSSPHLVHSLCQYEATLSDVVDLTTAIGKC